ncbi:putative pectinesterase/pectinesterase inhibitor 24, partial [Tanacetum coccineum]
MKWRRLILKDQKLLQRKKLPSGIKADIVVAKDGSRKYKKISNPIKAVHEKSKKRFVIYVKKGIYFENVRIEKPMWNVKMIGDGMNSVTCQQSLNVVDGAPTFQTTSFAPTGTPNDATASATT